MKGRVIKSTGSWYHCQLEDGQMVNARAIGKFRLKGLKVTNPFAVGDYVELEIEPGHETAIIKELYDRENYIIRKSPRHPAKNHIIASNLDQMIIMATVESPRTSTGFIDRLLVVGEMHHIPCIIVFNKKDVYTEKGFEKLEYFQAGYAVAGYQSLVISSLDEADISEIKALLKDKTTLFAGHSGVGKSTLINQLIPGVEISTNEISSTHSKGMHTTTFAEMHEMEKGTFIVDTPGIKELEVINLEPEEVCHYFPEMKARITDCKFNNCLHENEPKCAIKYAVLDDEIAEFRFDNYLNILQNVKDKNYWQRGE